ncbi:hypothetical protein NHX12_022223 [Muraenolepis orangiensis]|uniref:Male-enhanced antigen 1 n=1 Tax=Muraenolepis orangiensis TaxID=630683 RepID=A0A9Q0EMT4_9TELE|nr:hypothetical protein NHX12_022223 [Muraenolepis orangiensis]
MEVAVTGDMGPERILPNSEDDLGQERPSDGAVHDVVVVGGEWNGEDIDEEEGGGDGDGGVEGEEEENAGYYYQPLNQDPEGLNGLDPADTHTEQLQEVQDRIESMGLHLPPAPDSEEEAEPEGEVAERSHFSIPMDEDHVELVKRTMATIALPTLGVPAWAKDISEDQWTDMVQHTLQTHQSSSALRMPQSEDLD